MESVYFFNTLQTICIETKTSIYPLQNRRQSKSDFALIYIGSLKIETIYNKDIRKYIKQLLFTNCMRVACNNKRKYLKDLYTYHWILIVSVCNWGHVLRFYIKYILSLRTINFLMNIRCLINSRLSSVERFYIRIKFLLFHFTVSRKFLQGVFLLHYYID